MKDTRRLLPLLPLLLLLLAAAAAAAAAAAGVAAAAADRRVAKAPPGTKTARHGRTNRLQNRTEKLSNVTSGILLELKT